MARHVSIVLDQAKLKKSSRKINQPYKTSKLLESKIPADDREKTKKILLVAQGELSATVFDINLFALNLLKIAAPAIEQISFDIDKSTLGMKKVVEESGIRFGVNKFLATVF